MKDYRGLAETIYTRKSVRKYSKSVVELLEKDIDLMDAFNIQPLVDSIKVKVKILRKVEVKNRRSNYCIAFYSEEKPYYLENVGFIGQQIELELQAKGIGTCWWGMKKPEKGFKSIDGLECFITMTAGFPLNPETRTYPNGFKRKAAKEIIIGDTVSDQLIETIRIAPSAVNLQPWLVEKTGNKYSFYLRPPKTLIEKMIPAMRLIDMGIAIAHLFVQAKANGSKVSFNFEGNDLKQCKFIAGVDVG
ncbi:MAG: hypothetical protein FWD13_11475 [Treponema sp.]|nr:hypothetical protein [Treponema sp.]